MFILQTIQYDDQSDNTVRGLGEQSMFIVRIIKVKYTLVQALRLCAGRTAHRGNRGIALLFLDHGTRRGWGVSVTPRPLFTPGKEKVPIVQEAGWAPGSFWTRSKNLAPTGIRSPDRPARRQSLYRLRYAAQVRITRDMKIQRVENADCLYSDGGWYQQAQLAIKQCRRRI